MEDLVFDASGIARPTPADLERLARAALEARRSGRALVLRGCCDRLRLVLELTGLEEVFRFEADEPP